MSGSGVVRRSTRIKQRKRFDRVLFIDKDKRWRVKYRQQCVSCKLKVLPFIFSVKTFAKLKADELAAYSASHYKVLLHSVAEGSRSNAFH